MLKKVHRVPRDFFGQVSAGGKAYHSPHLTVKVAQRKGTLPSACSFVISHKVAKEATKRNLMKRRARGIMRGLLPNLKSGIAMVFFFRRGSAGLPFSHLEDEMRSLIEQAGVTKSVIPPRSAS
jgi:ribonuclease P protein component